MNRNRERLAMFSCVVFMSTCLCVHVTGGADSAVAAVGVVLADAALWRER